VLKETFREKFPFMAIYMLIKKTFLRAERSIFGEGEAKKDFLLFS
jgi:hypothetical protein